MEIRLRDAYPSLKDQVLMLAWRSNPLVYSGFYSQKQPLTWEEHVKWWNNKLHKRRVIFITTTEYEPSIIPRDIGIVYINYLEDTNPELSLFIGEIALWNQGAGTLAIRYTCNWLKDNGYSECHALIPENNLACRKVFSKIEFSYRGFARKYEEYWYKRIR